MKCILSSCLCITVCMHVSAQTDSIARKDTAIVLQKMTLKNHPAFSKHLFVTSILTDSNNRYFMFPDYQMTYIPSHKNYKLQTIYEVMGHTLLSVLADKNHYYYNSIPPKTITR